MSKSEFLRLLNLFGKPLLWGFLVIVMVALTGVAFYQVWPLLNPELVYRAEVDSRCDLRAGECSSDLPGGARVSFGITPRAIPLVKPLQLEVIAEGVEVESVVVDFVGVDMNMGFNRPELNRVSPGHFVGQGILPVCVRDSMEWEARVLLKTERGLLAAPYRFITTRP